MLMLLLMNLMHFLLPTVFFCVLGAALATWLSKLASGRHCRRTMICRLMQTLGF